jgi:hypothetical protein
VQSAAILDGIACPAVNQCVAVGATTANGEGVVVAVLNGVAGRPHPVPGVKSLASVSCSSWASCEAVGAGAGHGVVVQIRAGNPGSIQPVPKLFSLQSVSCAGSACDAGGRALLAGAFTTGASTILPVPTTTSVNGIACWAPETCEAVASTSNGSYNDVLVPLRGVPGSIQVVPPGTSTFSGIACPLPSQCLAVGRSAARRGGRVTQQAAVVSVRSDVPTRPTFVSGSASLALAAVSCASTGRCIAVGSSGSSGQGSRGRGAVLAVHNGTPGRPVDVGPPGLQLAGVSCPTTSRCWAVGSVAGTKSALILAISPNGS